MTWLWMYLSWIQDQEEKHNFATDYSIFLGSFSNPEAAQEMMSKRSPTFELSDEEFEESTRKVLESRNNDNNSENQIKNSHRRRRRKVLSQG